MNEIPAMLYRLLFIIIIVLYGNGIPAQEPSLPPQKLYDSDNLLDLKLELYFDSLLAGGTSEQINYPGILTLSENKKEIKFHVNLSKRGHFRKFPNICDFPPLRIHFKNKETVGTLFEDVKKTKIVTHCQNNDSAYEQYVIQEYLIYKAYNVLTEYSFRVRPARIRYIDLSKTYPDIQTYTFFIENPASVEKRLNGHCMDTKYLSPEMLDQRQYALMTMFEYMVINQDWSVSLCHNLEILAQTPGFQLKPIPFDFDMCGIISIPYKSPSNPFEKGTEPQRNFMGREINYKFILEAVDTLRAKKNDIIKVFNTSPLLTLVNRKNMVNRISDFYLSVATLEDILKLYSVPED